MTTRNMSSPPATQPCKRLTIRELKRINAALCASPRRWMCGCLGCGVFLALRGHEQMFLGFDMSEWLGAAFSGCLVMLSLWLLYQWAIKPEREIRRQIAWRATEEMHRNHWEHFRGRIYSQKRVRKRSEPTGINSEPEPWID